MNANVTVDRNDYERIAINLAELLDEISVEQEESLYKLIATAYQSAYQKAAEETEQQPALAAAG
jgi:DNA-binding protein YbaB